jgi:hypothetical protein
MKKQEFKTNIIHFDSFLLFVSFCFSATALKYFCHILHDKAHKLNLFEHEKKY